MQIINQLKVERNLMKERKYCVCPYFQPVLFGQYHKRDMHGCKYGKGVFGLFKSIGKSKII